ncbi:hypothetical protein Mycsm_05516 [Mycobacterium sp. JS623]|uniref:hypothetical protein n=1 Tax=Mycobacterium sp. JS623 TaxID=212767 RepID=UPI0002A59960|nr:hypothetical protein [Mycobacterium sp. JS623]AGB25704.1 hypothetical protein Mycsm_05516 [Mycobacterium sp. JS623]
MWRGLGEGEVGLSEVAASRLGVATGDSVELTTVDGPKRYRVAGTFRPRMINDTAVGDIVLVSEALARKDWPAVRDQGAVAYPSSDEATAQSADFLNIGAGLSVYDDKEWYAAATSGISRTRTDFAGDDSA